MSFKRKALNHALCIVETLYPLDKDFDVSKALRLIIGVPVALVVLVLLLTFRGESRYSSSLAQAKAKADAGDADGAFFTYGDAIRMAPDRVDAYFLRAAAMLKLKNYSKAQIDLNDIIRMQPNFGEAYRLRAECYRAQGLEDKGNEDDAVADRLGAAKTISDPEKVSFPK